MELPPIVGRLVGDDSHFQRTMRGANDSAGGLSKGLGAVKGAALALGGAFAAVKVGGFFKDAVLGASDLAETMSKVGVVFGESQKQVTGFANQMAKDFGLPKREILDAAASIGLIGKASGLSQGDAAKMSTELAKMAADASSFYNVPLPEALQAIQSGLVGEAEPMRRFGVLLSAQAVDAEAARLGLQKVNGAYAEGAKAQARASLIMAGMTDASGDLERTQGSLSNRLRELKGRFQNFTTEVGSKAVPVILKLMDMFEGLGKRVGPSFEKAMAGVKSFFYTLRSGFTEDEGTPIEGIALRIRTMVEGVVGFVQANWPRIKEIIGSVLSVAGAAVAGFVAVVMTAWENFGSDVLSVVQTAFRGLLAVGTVAMSALQAAIPPVVAGIQAILNVLGNPVFQAVALVISTALIPALIQWGIQSTIAAAKAVAAFVATNAAAITSAASQVLVFGLLTAQWIRMAAASLASAASVAAAWLIAIGPIALVIAAVVGLVALVIHNWDTIQAATGAAWRWIADHIGIMVRVIVGIMTGGMSEVALVVIRNWDRITGAVTGAIGTVVSLVASLPGRILGALGNLGGLLFDAGRAVIQGLINGIGSMVGAAVSAVKNAVGGVISGAKSLLGIGSPSRVFMGVGSDVMRGMAIGLAQGEGRVLDQVAHTMGSLSGPTLIGGGVRPAASSSAGSGNGGRPIVVQLVMPDGRLLAEVMVDPLRDALLRKSSRVPELFPAA